jgi:hypothetical protein
MKSLVCASILIVASIFYKSAPEGEFQQSQGPQYLSDIDADYKELEDLQKQMGQCKRASREEDIALFRQGIAMECARPEGDWMCKEAYKSIDWYEKQTPSTRCESTFSAYTRSFYAEEMNWILAEKGITERPKLGSLRYGDINDHTVRFRNREQFLITTNPDIEQFITETLVYVVNLIDISKDGEGIQTSFSPAIAAVRLDANPEVEANYKHILDGFLKTAVLPEPENLTATLTYLTPLHNRLVSDVADESSHFLIAHEYAHALLHHEMPDPSKYSSGTLATEIANRSYAQEIDADKRGFELWFDVLKSADRDEPFDQIVIAAPDVFLSIAELLESRQSHLRIPPVSRFPPAIERRARIRILMLQYHLRDEGKTDFGLLFHEAAMFAVRRLNRS